MADMPFVTVVVPACNEEAIITASIEQLVDHLHTIEHRYSWELIVVDDGSTDRTGELAEACAAADEHIRVFHHLTNFNLGQALRFAFNQARGRYIVTLDADLSYGPEHIERLLDAAVETGAKVVVASPYVKGGRTTAIPFFRLFLSRASNKLLSITAKGHLSTVTGMVRCYDRPFIQALSLKAGDMEINIEIVYKAQLMRAHIVEIPAHLDWTAQRALKGRRRSSIRMARSVAGQAFSSFLFRPFMFFVLPGIAVGLLSLYTLGFVAWNIVDRYGELSGSFDPRISEAVADVYHRSPHAFIVGGIALLVSVQLISLGLLSAQSKRYFEELFHLGTLSYRQLRVPEVWPPLPGWRESAGASPVELPSSGPSSAGTPEVGPDREEPPAGRL